MRPRPGHGCEFGELGQRVGTAPGLLMAQLGVLLQQPIQGLHEVRHAIVLGNIPEDSDLLHEDLQETSHRESQFQRRRRDVAEAGRIGRAAVVGEAPPWFGW